VKLKETEKEKHSLHRRLAQIEQEIKNQTANLRTAPEEIIKAIYTDIGELTRELEEKQSCLDTLNEEDRKKSEQLADIEKAKQAILDFPRMVELFGYEGKLQLIRKIIEFIVVKDDDVHIFLKGTVDNADTMHSQEYVNELTQMCHIDTHSKRDEHYMRCFHQ